MVRSYRNRFISATILVLCLLAAVSLLFISEGKTVASHSSFAAAVPLTGWLWAGTADASGVDTGIGWISLNCLNSGCNPSNYKVQINPDMTVTGYAWSPYSGWIQFGSQSGCPAGTCAARVTGSDATGWELSGWARACGVFVSGCSGTLKDNGAPDYERGNWDGWISLNCANTGGCGTSAYKVSIPATGGFTSGSNGWGGDVLGRVNFAFADFNPPCTSHGTCSADLSSTMMTNLWCEDTSVTCASDQLCSPVTGSCTTIPVIPPAVITVSQAVVKPGDVITITWTADASLTSCTLTSNDGLTITGGATGSGSSNPVSLNRTTFVLTCVDPVTGIPVEVAEKTIQTAGKFEET